MDRLGFTHAVWLAALSLLVLPAVASAADTFADASRPDDSGDCLTPATACKTINGAIGKAGVGDTVRIEPGTYAENVSLSGGISLVAVSSSPTISPAAGTGVEVTGGPAATIHGLTFSSNVTGSVELQIDDDAGSTMVTGNTFTDPTPMASDNQVGIRTTSKGNPQIANNRLSGLFHGIEVGSPAAGLPGAPLISGNTISGNHDNGDGIQVVSSSSHAVTGPTGATLVDNLIRDPGSGQSSGVLVLDGGSFSMDTAAPTAALTMVRNRILGGIDGVQDFGARGPVTLFGDVIARTGSIVIGGTAINAAAVNQLGGDLTLTNVDLVNNVNLALELQDNHLTLDSSIVTEGTFKLGTTTCTITFSDGPTTSGDSCETFQTSAKPSFVDQSTDDYHLTASGNSALIDQGNPAAPPIGSTDFDGDPRAIDADGACPLNPVRDIGADEFNPGIPDCPAPPSGGGGPPVSPPGPTGQRAAALKKCKRKHSTTARKRCRKRAKLLPV
ncbi:MAG: right-handed parallel beta-helix repeat-containing protein [Solirubrobacterales bacterium]